ncbi:GILT protein F37H8.5-like [Tropilaelaps mercedesae]|uniref:GILT protein F37H8.5-like n=1 Tax=Tropilaelaps mercedesae TaxID=418985 RepID=A0A1V9XW42_9ACAR|nr:GILT protein F37H8.5-like [Tropilaelaps mercedesae]
MLRYVLLLTVANIPALCTTMGVTNVMIFYETLCPASFRQLSHVRETMTKFGDSIFISLVPFGHAQIAIALNGSLYAHCQHGPDECTGNAWHACSHFYMEPKEQLEYAICTMHNDRELTKNLKKCTTPDIVAQLEMCASGSQGSAAVRLMGDLTVLAGAAVDPQGTRCLTGVPSLFVDGHYLSRSDRMRYSLSELICLKASRKPSQCATQSQPQPRYRNNLEI